MWKFTFTAALLTVEGSRVARAFNMTVTTLVIELDILNTFDMV